MPEAFVARVFCWAVGCLPGAFSGSSSGQRLRCILDVRLRMTLWLWLGSAFSVVEFVCFLVVSPPSSPYSGKQGLLLNSFSIELTVQCDGCLIWGSGVAGEARGWVASRAGLWGVPPTWVWVVGVSPQILEHPTSICDTGVKSNLTQQNFKRSRQSFSRIENH